MVGGLLVEDNIVFMRRRLLLEGGTEIVDEMELDVIGRVEDISITPL